MLAEHRLHFEKLRNLKSGKDNSNCFVISLYSCDFNANPNEVSSSLLPKIHIHTHIFQNSYFTASHPFVLSCLGLTLLRPKRRKTGRTAELPLHPRGSPYQTDRRGRPTSSASPKPRNLETIRKQIIKVSFQSSTFGYEKQSSR